MKNKTFIIGMTMALLSSFEVQAQSANCCCTDCVCPPGAQGTVGAQGVQGNSGIQGVLGTQGSTGTQGIAGVQGTIGTSGAQGAQGIQGAVGPQGVPGIQGVPGAPGIAGPTGPCCQLPGSSASVLNAYSTLDQTLNPLDAVLFDGINVVTSTSYDTSLASTTGQITFLVSGNYILSWTAEGQLTTPFPDPVPAWSLSLFLDGAPIPGSCFSGFTLFPAELTNNTGGTVVVAINAGQVLTLLNTSTLAIALLSSIPGSTLPESSASLVIQSQN